MKTNFPCILENCDKSFTQPQDLRLHQQTHHIPKIPTKPLFPFKPSQQKPFEKLTTMLILDTTNEENLESITQLTLRNQGLKTFNSNEDINLDRLMNLEYLTLSHNFLQDIEGVREMLNLQEINLNNNLISDITPLESLAQLRRLFLANNQVKVVLPLKPLKQLTEISLYNNKLFDLDQSLLILRELPKLKVLELERNPCVLQTQNSRYRILHLLKLEMLDTLQVNESDFQIAVNLFGEREKFIPKNLIGRLRANAEANSEVEKDLLCEELEEAKLELMEVRRERDELLEEKEKRSKESVKSLKEENLTLRREVASMYALLDEVNELKSRLKENLADYAAEVYEENFRLKNKISELEEKQKEVIRRPQTSAGIRPVTAAAKEMNSDEIYDFIERNNRMLINLDSKVSAYKKSLDKNGK